MTIFVAKATTTSAAAFHLIFYFIKHEEIFYDRTPDCRSTQTTEAERYD
jgi:hypothetical protein